MLSPIVLLSAVLSVFSLNITFLEKPSTYQLYPRAASNNGTLRVRGTLNDAGFDTFSVTLTRNNLPYARSTAPAVYSGNTASFDFQLPIPAELAEYGVRFWADTVLALSADSLVAGDAYAISGQSNSITFINGDIHEYIRTYKGGKWKVSEEGAPSGTPDVGLWGQQIAFHINEEQGLPVFVVNGGVPSMSISYFTPGSTGYVDVLNRSNAAGLRNYIKAVFYYQGEADCGPGYGSYAASFNQLYQGWKSDYPAVKRVYVCQLGIWAQVADVDVPWARNLREVQRNFPKTCPDVRVMATLGSPEGGAHWGGAGYRSIGDKLYRLVARDIYGSGDTASISPPNLLRAFYSSPVKDRITLVFDQPTYWKDSLGHTLANYFALDSAYKVVDSGWSEPQYNRIILKLKAPSNATKITYLTGGYYHADDRVGVPSGYFPVYNGPFLFNARRVGALTFHEAPVEAPLPRDTASAQTLTLTASKTILLRFESAQLTALVAYVGGGPDTNQAVYFRSLDTIIVRVGPDGLVRGFNPGTGRVTATRGGLSDTVTITVGAGFAPLTGIEFSAKAASLRTLLAGDSMPFGLVVRKAENGDTLRFAADTLAALSVPGPNLTTRGSFIYAAQAGESLLVSAQVAGLRCSTWITVVALPSFIRRVNFQSSNAPQKSIPGWILESGTPYSAARGLGWVNASGLSGYSIETREPNYFRNTMINTQQNGVEQTFRIDAPAGDYRIRVRNFNLFFCYDTSYVRYGTDTLLFNPICNYSWDYDAQVTRNIKITGDSGLALKVYGAVCYLILASDDGGDFNLIAKDEAGVTYPPPLTVESEEGQDAKAMLAEVPVVSPNPFNPATVVRFGLPGGISADFGVYNVRGQCVKRFHFTALNGSRAPMVRIDTNGAAPLASGIYYGRLIRSDGKQFVRKLVLVR